MPPLHAIAVVVGNQCSANCADCLSASSTTGRDWIADADVDRLHAWVAANGEPGEVVVTGGEPGMRPELLDRLLGGFRTARKRVITNGFWGTNAALAPRVVRAVAANAVDRVQISFGDEHLRWVRPEAIFASVVRVLAGTGAVIDLTVEQAGVAATDPVRRLAAALRKLDPSRVAVGWRAWTRRRDGEYRFAVPAEETCDDGSFCSQIAGPWVTVDHDGRVYRCSGPHVRALGPTSAYALGTLADGFVVPFSPADRHGPTFRRVAGSTPLRLADECGVPADSGRYWYKCSLCRLAAGGGAVA
ncbi:MAG TPA: hypothetical protein VD866_17740 [Urbifossiella sp.]|nr:hypothetical protein [Urbifossiella sp.]